MIWFVNDQGRIVQVLLKEEAVQAYAKLYPKVNYFFAKLVTE